jgi:hypothetical protein
LQIVWYCHLQQLFGMEQGEALLHGVHDGISDTV